jgi:hypothetical protein
VEVAERTQIGLSDEARARAWTGRHAGRQAGRQKEHQVLQMQRRGCALLPTTRLREKVPGGSEKKKASASGGCRLKKIKDPRAPRQAGDGCSGPPGTPEGLQWAVGRRLGARPGRASHGAGPG